MLIGKTQSVCPTCGTTCPAVLVEADKVYLDTYCVMHGPSRGVVEPSVPFFHFVRTRWSPSIYDGVLLDVTRRCNARCSYCFQDLRGGADPSIEELVRRSSVIPTNYPIILSGGEPTLREDLPEIVQELGKTHPIVILTNGFKVDFSLPAAWVLSYHSETFWSFDAALRLEGQFFSIIYTADSPEEFLNYLGSCLKLRQRAQSFRIHSVAPVGANHGGQGSRLYLSEMVGLAKQSHDVELVGPGKTVYFPTKIDGVDMKLVSWSSKYDIDLIDLACPPFYLTDRGMEHLVTTLVKREFQ